MNDTNKKLILEWLGYKVSPWSIHPADDYKEGEYRQLFGGVELLLPDDKGDMPSLEFLRGGEWHGLPAFDLNFYFEYAVPKLQWFKVLFEHIEVSCRYYVTLTDFYLAQPCKEYEAIDEDPAEALGQALLSLIKDKK